MSLRSLRWRHRCEYYIDWWQAHIRRRSFVGRVRREWSFVQAGLQVGGSGGCGYCGSGELNGACVFLHIPHTHVLFRQPRKRHAHRSTKINRSKTNTDVWAKCGASSIRFVCVFLWLGKLAQVKIGLFMRSFPVNCGMRNYFVSVFPRYEAGAIDLDLISRDWFMHPAVG